MSGVDFSHLKNVQVDSERLEFQEMAKVEYRDERNRVYHKLLFVEGKDLDGSMTGGMPSLVAHSGVKHAAGSGRFSTESSKNDVHIPLDFVLVYIPLVEKEVGNDRRR